MRWQSVLLAEQDGRWSARVESNSSLIQTDGPIVDSDLINLHPKQVNKNVLATRTYQDAALANSLDALMLFAGASSYCAGFPELVVPIVMQLKLFARSTQVARFRRQVRTPVVLTPVCPACTSLGQPGVALNRSEVV